ncbi:MAG: hypothetical protein Q4D79_05585 [Propionibacteriaceae bacterium]|nr:hypothetical protein [Propionibacteriaceae bacterium]
MSLELWQEVPEDTNVWRADKASLLVLPLQEEPLVATVHANGDSFTTIRYARVSNLNHPLYYDTVEQTIGPPLRTVARDRDLRIVAIPPVQWGTQGFDLRTPASAIMLGIVVTGLAMIVALGVAYPATLLASIPLYGVLVGGMAFRLNKRGNRPTQIVTAGSLELDGSNLVDYVGARLRGERPELPTETQRRTDIVARVEGIKEEYGRLTSDLAYRIENSALFDSSVPLTSVFLVQLGRYDNEAADLATDDLDDLAAELEISYATARDHAETVGFGHLPATARPEAGRAAKAARLAAETANDGERAAALEQVRRILESLALYYLPVELVRRAITDGSPAA